MRTTATTTPEITAVGSTDEPEEGGEDEAEEEEMEGEETEGGGEEGEGGKVGGEGREVIEKEERVVEMVREGEEDDERNIEGEEEDRDPRGVVPIVEEKEEGNGVIVG